MPESLKKCHYCQEESLELFGKYEINSGSITDEYFWTAGSGSCFFGECKKCGYRIHVSFLEVMDTILFLPFYILIPVIFAFIGQMIDKSNLILIIVFVSFGICIALLLPHGFYWLYVKSNIFNDWYYNYFDKKIMKLIEDKKESDSDAGIRVNNLEYFKRHFKSKLN